VKGAGLTVVDSATRGPMIEPYKPFAREDREEDEEQTVPIG